jgi:hypothetical protein
VSRKRVSLITGMVLIGAIAWATAALAANPYVFTAWKKITISQTACLQHATAVLTSNGYTGIIPGTSTDTVLGNIGDFTGLIRCAAGDPGVVFFVVAGPDQPVVVNYSTVIWSAF